MLVRTPSPPPGFKISRHLPQTIEHRPSLKVKMLKVSTIEKSLTHSLLNMYSN